MSESSNPVWRYGVVMFPVPPLLSLIALGGLIALISIPTTETGVLVGIAAFLVTVLSFWLAVLVAVVVAVSLFLDARTLARQWEWSPNQYVFGAIGLVHLAATELSFLYVISVPSILYYVYRRRQSVP